MSPRRRTARSRIVASALALAIAVGLLWLATVYVSRGHGKGDLAVCRKLGGLAAESHLRTIYKRLVVHGDPLSTLLLFPAVWLVYLAQTDDNGLEARARAAADRLGLEFRVRRTGYGDLAPFLSRAARGRGAAATS